MLKFFFLQNIHRHLERKHAALANVNNYINQESVATRSETDLVNSSSQDDLKNHKHRHQRIESTRNLNRTIYPQLNDLRDEKESGDNSVPDACYCVPHSQ